MTCCLVDRIPSTQLGAQGRVTYSEGSFEASFEGSSMLTSKRHEQEMDLGTQVTDSQQEKPVSCEFELWIFSLLDPWTEGDASFPFLKLGSCGQSKAAAGSRWALCPECPLLSAGVHKKESLLCCLPSKETMHVYKGGMWRLERHSFFK